MPKLPDASIEYEPAEPYGDVQELQLARTVWFPVNYLVIRTLLQYEQFAGPEFTTEYPTGSGRQVTLREMAGDLADRLVSIWLPGADGRRPVYGGRAPADRPGLEGQPAVLRILPRRQRRRTAPCTRPAGRLWSPTCYSIRRVEAVTCCSTRANLQPRRALIMAAQLTDAAHPLLYEINPSLDVLDGDSRLLNVLKSQRPHGGGPIHAAGRIYACGTLTLTEPTQNVSNARPATTLLMDCSSVRDLRTACVPPRAVRRRQGVGFRKRQNLKHLSA